MRLERKNGREGRDGEWKKNGWKGEDGGGINFNQSLFLHYFLF